MFFFDELDTDDNIFGKRMGRRRKELQLSYKQLEDLTGISRSTLNRYEKGSSPIPMSKISKIAEALQVSNGYLFGEESKDLPRRYYESIQPILKEIGYRISYDDHNETFSLTSKESSYPIEIEEIKDIKKFLTSLAKFKISEIINSFPKDKEEE